MSGGLSPWLEIFSTNLSLQKDNPIIANTKLMWHKVHRAGRWDFFKSPHAPLWNNKQILIGNKTVNWTIWQKAGINCIFHLFDSNTKLCFSFNQLVDRYKLPHDQYWRYVQLRSTLSKWLRAAQLKNF